MNALAWFDLPVDASERDLKREYARRLKAVRPDEDAEGFQRLHTAYQAALAWLQQRNAWREHGRPGDVVPDQVLPVEPPSPAAQAAAVPRPTFVPRQVRVNTPAQQDTITFDFDGFYRDITTLAARRDADAASMRSMLLGNEALWHIGLKGAVSRTLIRRLWEQKPAMSPSSFDALTAFFDEWRFDRGRDQYDLIPLRRELQERYFGFSELKRPPRKTYGDGYGMLLGILIAIVLAITVARNIGNNGYQDRLIDPAALQRPAVPSEPVDLDKVLEVRAAGGKPTWLPPELQRNLQQDGAADKQEASAQ